MKKLSSDTEGLESQFPQKECRSLDQWRSQVQNTLIAGAWGSGRPFVEKFSSNRLVMSCSMYACRS